MSPSPPFATFGLYLAVIFGPGLIGWAIGGFGPFGFVMGIGAGLVVLGFTLALASRLSAVGHAAMRHEEAVGIRVSLDRDDFGRLIRGQVVGHPGGVRIALQDIGWDVMAGELRNAALEARDVP